jgi:hypothetical protein
VHTIAHTHTHGQPRALTPHPRASGWCVWGWRRHGVLTTFTHLGATCLHPGVLLQALVHGEVWKGQGV